MLINGREYHLEKTTHVTCQGCDIIEEVGGPCHIGKAPCDSMTIMRRSQPKQGKEGREKMKQAVKAMEERGKLKEQVRILREALTEANERIKALSPDGYIAPERWRIESALEATKEVP